MLNIVREFGLGFTLVGVLVIAWLAGKAIGRRTSSKLGEHPQLTIVQSAILALLGLLLGFCFSGAISRFVERQDILVREGNAISTAWLRADLLDDPSRSELKLTLGEYAAARLELFSAGSPAADSPVRVQLDALQHRAWTIAVNATRDQPHLVIAVVPALNEVIDLLSTRNAADSRHIPYLVSIVLVACAMASVGTIGFGVEASDKRLRLPAAVLIFLIAATLWVTMDLDYPRFGLIRVSDQPLRDALSAMTERSPAASP